MIVLLAALKSVPATYYEAATMDGAGSARKFFCITLPGISPAIFFQVVITTVNALQAFEYIYMLTRRTQGESTMATTVYLIYRNGFRWFNTARETYWGQIFSGCEDQGWVTPERMLDDMDRAGIDKAIIQGNYWRHHDTCVDRNSEVLDLLARWPDRFIGFATLQPQVGQAALDELSRCLDGGMRV